ncbi:MAG: hypothetical protein KAQ71_14945, partial [Desulfobulbaceae bacterium]|nr:hypothetical protein [Desulfobulbaceae bacterium]
MFGQHTTNDREYRRLRVKDGNLVLIKADSIVVAPVVNISKKGLAFQYIKDSETSLRGSRELYIVSTNDDFILENLSFEKISESDVVNYNPITRIPMPIQCCGVKFCNITPEQ